MVESMTLGELRSLIWQRTQEAQKEYGFQASNYEGTVGHNLARGAQTAMEALCKDVWGRVPKPGDPATGPEDDEVRDLEITPERIEAMLNEIAPKEWTRGGGCTWVVYKPRRARIGMIHHFATGEDTWEVTVEDDHPVNDMAHLRSLLQSGPKP